MQITNTSLARSVWFLDMLKLNPRGTAVGPMHRALAERYRFVNPPVLGPDTFNGTKGLVYAQGEFAYEGQQLSIGITIYNDGWMADSGTSTDVADAFLEDLSDWLVATFSFNDPRSLIKRRVYDSELYLKSENVQLGAISEKIRRFSEILKKYTDNDTEEPWAILFEPDGGPNSFSFERRVGVPFSQNEYYSKAALSTSKHIELLNQFEAIFT